MSLLRSFNWFKSSPIAQRDPGHWTSLPDSDPAVITHESAMKFSAVYSAVSLISETIAALPVGVYAKFGAKRYTRPKPPWMQRPNSEANWFTFMQQSLASVLMGGDAFGYKVRLSDGLVYELWPIDPRRVTVSRPVGGERQYEIDGRAVPADDIVHVPGLMLPGYLRGLSPIECARQTIELGLSAETFANSFYRNSATVSGVIQAVAGTTKAEAEEMWEIFTAKHGGAAQAQGVSILAGAEYKPIALTQEQAQFLQTRSFQVSEIARWFRIPPHMIADVEKDSSWGTGIEQQEAMFVTHTLRPWITRFEYAFDELIRDFAIANSKTADPGWYVRFNVNGLLRGDSAARAALYQTLAQTGAASPNWILQKEDEEPYDGGDSHFIPSGYYAIGSDGQPIVPQTSAREQP